MQKIQKNGDYAIKILSIILSVAIASIFMSSPFVAIAVADAHKRVVVIDAGHGGKDAGVRGKNTGVKESDLNLQVAKLLGEYLRGAGYKIVYTRTNDTMHTYPAVKDNKKRADMFKRRDIISKAQPSAVISIHMNFYSSQSRRGAQVFFDRRNDDSRELAYYVQNMLNEDINSDCGRKYAALHADKFLLSCSPYPSVIVECGFLSNPIDEANLSNPNYQAKFAYVLFLGIINWLCDGTL